MLSKQLPRTQTVPYVNERSPVCAIMNIGQIAHTRSVLHTGNCTLHTVASDVQCWQGCPFTANERKSKRMNEEMSSHQWPPLSLSPHSLSTASFIHLLSIRKKIERRKRLSITCSTSSSSSSLMGFVHFTLLGQICLLQQLLSVSCSVLSEPSSFLLLPTSSSAPR